MLVIGSRGSKLALWQANYTKARLEALGHECRIEIITTSGDRFQSGPLKEVGNKGLFTKEIEEALLDGSVDVAVHSLKDMPGALPEGLTIVATPEREDPRDAMVGMRLADVPPGGRVGTGSVRRVAQIIAARPDVIVEPIRGNVDTRLRKLDEGQFDAIVLAAAGLRRLGWEQRIAEYLEPETMCPAIGQGALAIETRADEGAAMQACRALNHADTYAAVMAERAVLRVLGGGCQIPVGAYAHLAANELRLSAIVSTPDGKQIIRRAIAGPPQNWDALGSALGQQLVDAGAWDILLPVYGHAG